MKLDGLSLEQAPPISVPFRFFIAAPLIGLLSVVLFWISGADVLASRWSPGTLAVVHGWLLGFFGTVMFGALLQMLPVLAGVVIKAPRRLANLLLPCWLLGVVTLQFAFVRSDPGLFQAAALLLAIAVSVFVYSCGTALFRATSQINSVMGMKMALLSLFIALVFGVFLALGNAGVTILLRPLGTDIHAMWGLLGWISLLIMAVSWQVVPMFQITKPYPRWSLRWLAPSLFVLFILRMLLVLLSLWLTLPEAMLFGLALLLDLLISAALVAFAATTLWLQSRRKRKLKDTHPLYWRVGCVGLLITIAGWWLIFLVGDQQLREQLRFLCVLIFMTGFVTAIMTGMLYKIVAFLVWFHLQGLNTRRMMAGESAIQVPHMKTVIRENRARLQFRLFLLALASVPLTWAWPHLYGLAVIFWGLHFAMMLVNLAGAVGCYRNAVRDV